MATKKFVQWLKVNKEGAVIGGIIGGLFVYLTFGRIDTHTQLSDILAYFIRYNPIMLLGKNCSGEDCMRYALLSIWTLPLFGIIIGAFIDSIWRKNK